MSDNIREYSTRREFTDLPGAIDEAHFLSEKHGRKYILVQLLLGGIHVVLAHRAVGQVIYSTHRDSTHKSNLWPKNQDLTLASYHRGAA